MSARAKYEFHLKNWSDIQDHLPRIYEAAKGNCIEIGVRSGVSTSAILAGIEAHGGHLYSMDVHDCQVFSGHPDWTFLRVNTVLDGNKVNLPKPELLFVDGDHTYFGALSDLRNFGQKAKRIFVHDTDCPDTFPGVRQAVETFCEETGKRVTYHSGSYGMAEIV